MNKLRFINGREFGLNRYYNEDGKKWLRFRAFKDGLMIVSYYNENGRKESKGWHGKWKFYEDGKTGSTANYNMGQETE